MNFGGEYTKPSMYFKVWPEVVGMKLDEAKALIKGERSDYFFDVFVVDTDYLLTLDRKMDRVRIFVDKDNIVVKVPGNG